MNDAVDLLEGGVSDVNLSQLGQLINQLMTIRGRREDLEQQLREIKEEERQLEGRLIPEAMQGMTLITLDNGYRVSLKRKLRANISEGDKEFVFGWMTDNGHGDLIKADVIAKFGRSELEEAQALIDEINQTVGCPVELKQNIHWATLDKWTNEQLERGLELPEQIAVFEVNKVEVKRA